MYIFFGFDSQNLRKILWEGERKAERIVYKKNMKRNNPEQISYCEHFGFRTEYKRFCEDWYLLIKPDWFYSYDGYKKSLFHKDKVTDKKKLESNKTVYNHLRFIRDYINRKIDLELFQKDNIKIWINFESLLTFDNSPKLQDKEFLPSNFKSKIDNNIDHQTQTTNNKNKQKSENIKQLSLDLF